MPVKSPARLVPHLAFVAATVGLFAHAHRFDFVCDDAFISLRYAENFARLGVPVYNPGEHVEGYTNFLFMALVAVAVKLGAVAVPAVRALGGLSGIALVGGTLFLLRRVLPERPWASVPVLGAGACSAPIAAWTLSGLETPLFAALVAFGIALAADLSDELAAPRRAVLAGVVLGLATMTRPEGTLVFGLAFLVAALDAIRTRDGRIRLVAFAAGYGALVVPFVAWRYHTYGYPFPNTFYLKSSGDPAALRAQGLAYVEFAARELGPAFLVLVLFALLVPSPKGAGDASSMRRRAALRTIRLVVAAYIPYVISVGGDFLDLYRFFVPLLPLAFVAIAVAFDRFVDGLSHVRGTALVAFVLSLGLVVLYDLHDYELGSRALLESEEGRAAHGIEPLGWTKLYARRWAAMGRWLRAHASEGDSLAVGAAGAMPYYSGLPNLDTFGLCDSFVAHHGDLVGTRPGHQRFAPEFYIAERRPTFLLVGTDFTTDAPLPSLPIGRDPRWESRGYVFVEAHVDAERYGAPRGYYHYLLVDGPRAEALRGRPDVRLP